MFHVLESFFFFCQWLSVYQHLLFSVAHLLQSMPHVEGEFWSLRRYSIHAAMPFSAAAVLCLLFFRYTSTIVSWWFLLVPRFVSVKPCNLCLPGGKAPHHAFHLRTRWALCGQSCWSRTTAVGLAYVLSITALELSYLSSARVHGCRVAAANEACYHAPAPPPNHGLLAWFLLTTPPVFRCRSQFFFTTSMSSCTVYRLM